MRWRARITATFPPERLSAMRTTVSAARERGLEAGYTWLKNSSLLPHLQEMVRAVDTPEAWEAYTIGYRFFSSWTHLGATSFISNIEITDEVADLYDGPPRNPRSIRQLAAIAFAYLLEIASEHLGLSLEHEARDIRAALLA